MYLCKFVCVKRMPHPVSFFNFDAFSFLRRKVSCCSIGVVSPLLFFVDNILSFFFNSVNADYF